MAVKRRGGERSLSGRFRRTPEYNGGSGLGWRSLSSGLRNQSRRRCAFEGPSRELQSSPQTATRVSIGLLEPFPLSPQSVPFLSLGPPALSDGLGDAIPSRRTAPSRRDFLLCSNIALRWAHARAFSYDVNRLICRPSLDRAVARMKPL